MNKMLGRMMLGRILTTATLATLGVFFIASGWQGSGRIAGRIVYASTNLFGQKCNIAGGCFHPEWVAVGVGILVVAFLFYRHHDKILPPPQ